jgi:hypothetical protein
MKNRAIQLHSRNKEIIHKHVGHITCRNVSSFLSLDDRCTKKGGSCTHSWTHNFLSGNEVMLGTAISTMTSLDIAISLLSKEDERL